MGRAAHLQRLAQGRSYTDPPDWSNIYLQKRFKCISEDPLIFECVDRDSPFFRIRYDGKGRPWDRDARKLADNLADAQDKVTEVSMSNLADHRNEDGPRHQPQNIIPIPSGTGFRNFGAHGYTFIVIEKMLDCYIWDSILARILWSPFYDAQSLFHILLLDIDSPHILFRTIGSASLCFISNVFHERLRQRILSELPINKRGIRRRQKTLVRNYKRNSFAKTSEALLSLSFTIVSALTMSWLKYLSTVVPIADWRSIIRDPSPGGVLKLDQKNFFQSGYLLLIHFGAALTITELFKPPITGLLHYAMRIRNSEPLNLVHYRKPDHSFLFDSASPTASGYATSRTIFRLHERLNKMFPNMLFAPGSSSASSNQSAEWYDQDQDLLFKDVRWAVLFHRFRNRLAHRMAKILLVPLQAMILYKIALAVRTRAPASLLEHARSIMWKIGLCTGISLVGVDLGSFWIQSQLWKL